MVSLLLFSILFTTVALVLPPHAHAIIFLPALILIPVAKIIAVIITGFSLPAIGLGALWKKITGASTKKIIGIILGALILIAVLVAVVLKILNPDRPLF